MSGLASSLGRHARGAVLRLRLWPLRAVLVSVSLAIVAGLGIWHEAEQLRWQARQAQRSAFMGRPAWRVERQLPAWREALRELAPWPQRVLDRLQQRDWPALLLSINTLSFAEPGAKQAESAILALANAKALQGLPARADGVVPCVLLGHSARIQSGQWLRLGPYATCRLQEVPLDWQGLDGEFSESVLVIPAAHAAWLMTGTTGNFGKRALFTTLYLPAADEAGLRALLSALGEMDVRVQRTAAAHNDSAQTQAQLVGAQRWLDPAARLLSAICLLLYGWSLWKALSLELALRQAIGIPPVARFVWLFTELFTQFCLIAALAAWLALGVDAALMGLSHACQWLNAAWRVLLAAAALAFTLAGLLWLARHHALGALGKP